MKENKQCYHFTKMCRADSINQKGLLPRAEDNCKSVGDTKKKVSYSLGKVGAVGLYANFYEVYQRYKTGKRMPRPERPGEVEMHQSIMRSKDFEDFLSDGIFLLFDQDGFENEGGNHGIEEGNIYDCSTTKEVPSDKLHVGFVKNNDTGEVSYSRKDYMHYLMGTLSNEEYSQLIPEMQQRYKVYLKDHLEEVKEYRTGNYSIGESSLKDFCKEHSKDIQKALQEQSKKDQILKAEEKEQEKEDKDLNEQAKDDEAR